MSKKTEETPEEKSEKAYNKLQSRRFWICVWAAVVVTGIVAGSYIRDNYQLTGLAMGLEGIIAAYIGIESWNKRYKMQQDQKQEESPEC